MCPIEFLVFTPVLLAYVLSKNVNSSSLEDAQKALEYKPDYNKSRWRAAQCAFELKRFDVCSQLSDEILENDANDKNSQELRMKNKIRRAEKERKRRWKKDEDRYYWFSAICHKLGLEKNGKEDLHKVFSKYAR